MGESSIGAHDRTLVDEVLAIVHEVVGEVHPAGPVAPITLDSRLERDLGLDSLAIVELGARTEERCGARLTEAQLAEVHLAGVRRGRVAVFGVMDIGAGTERLIVLAETRESEGAARAALRDRIVGVTVDLLGTPPDDVVLARPGTVLKTSSGKIRRAASREAYERGHLDTNRGPAWWQLTRFAGSTAAPRLRRARRAISGTLFALYAWSWLAALAPIAWLLVALLPTRRARWAAVRGCAKVLARATRTKLDVTGTERVTLGEPYVATANHPSFLDALALATVLPGAPCFVAASELERRPVTRVFLHRLGTEFIEREDREQSIAGARRLLERAR